MWPGRAVEPGKKSKKLKTVLVDTSDKSRASDRYTVRYYLLNLMVDDIRGPRTLSILDSRAFELSNLKKKQ